MAWPNPPVGSVDLVGCPAQLPHRMRARYDPTRRRLRKKQREAAARKARKARQRAARASRAATPCRFGAACTRAGCWYAHPARRTPLPKPAEPEPGAASCQSPPKGVK